MASTAATERTPRRCPRTRGTSDAVEPAHHAPQDAHTDVAASARTSDGLERAHPSRRLPGRLVTTGNIIWLVLEDRPDQFALLRVRRMQSKKLLPVEAREFEVAGDTSRRVTFWAPGPYRPFAARSDLGDRVHRWWVARSQRRQGRELAGEVHGSPSHPSIAAAAPLQPDPLQSAWAHPPARERLQRSLWRPGGYLAVALLLAVVIVWEAVNPQDWFYEPSESGDAEGIAFVHIFIVLTAIMVVAGALPLRWFFGCRSTLRRQPWRLADIMSPDSDHVVLREHGGAHGPLRYKVSTFRPFQERDRVRVLACKQLWFAMGNGGTLVAAMPDFRVVARLQPDRTRADAS